MFYRSSIIALLYGWTMADQKIVKSVNYKEP